MKQPLTQSIPKKSRLLAFILGLACGPFAFLYVGWRYGLVAIVYLMLTWVTLSIPWISEVVLMAAPIKFWTYVHCFVMGLCAAAAVENRNRAIERGDTTAFEESKSMNSAVATVLEACFAVLSSVICLSGAIVAFKHVREGEIVAALIVFFVLTPFHWLLASIVLFFSNIILGLIFTGVASLFRGKAGAPE